MPVLKIVWMPASEATFKALRQRPIDAGRYTDFMQAHNEVAIAVRDPELAFEKGELLYRTRKPGGEVRVWVNRMIASVTRFFAMRKRAGSSNTTPYRTGGLNREPAPAF
jgi:hypothetical protein